MSTYKYIYFQRLEHGAEITCFGAFLNISLISCANPIKLNCFLTTQESNPQLGSFLSNMKGINTLLSGILLLVTGCLNVPQFLLEFHRRFKSYSDGRSLIYSFPLIVRFLFYYSVDCCPNIVHFPPLKADIVVNQTAPGLQETQTIHLNFKNHRIKKKILEQTQI